MGSAPGGHRPATRGDALAPAERRQLTVVFCDLVGSTELAAGSDPETVLRIVHACLSSAAARIEAEGGFVAQFLGDGLLAFFGYPQATENDAERAVRAGLAVVKVIGRLDLPGGYRARMRVGIATGLVVVGEIPFNSRECRVDAVGSAPNFAARLQSLAAPGAVVVDATTRRLVGGMFRCSAIRDVELSGFAGRHEVWTVAGPSVPDSQPSARGQSGVAPLVGRDMEVASLLSKWELASMGVGQVVHLTGEPGIGKSRLALALLDAISRQNHTCLRLYCSQRARRTPFHPFIAHLERRAGFTPSDGETTRLHKLASLLGRRHDEIEVAALADLMSLRSPDGALPSDLTPQRKRALTIQALRRQFEIADADAPLVAVVEDLHWIDPSSLGLLQTIAEGLAKHPVLLILSSREPTHLPAGDHVSEIRLAAIPDDGVAKLIEAVPGADALSRTAVAQIIRRSDGVPLFAEELTMAVVEARATDGPGREASVPTTLQSSLMGRIDRLGPAKRIAQMGAAIGRSFTYDFLSALSGIDDADLDQAIARLTRAGLLIERKDADTRRLMFRHALIQDVAYASMLIEVRRGLHAQIIDTLQTSFPGRIAMYPDMAAHHCAEAGRAYEGARYWLKAGRQALSRSALTEAVVRLREGLALVASLAPTEDHLRLELQIQVSLGQALIATTGYTSHETVRAYARARAICGELDAPPQQATVMHGQWVYDLMRNDLHSAQRRAGELFALGQARGDPIFTLMGHRCHGVSSFALGKFDQARRSLRAGIEAFDPRMRADIAQLTIDDAQVVMLVYLSWVEIYLGRFEEGVRLRDHALVEAQQTGNAYSMAHALNGIAFTELLLRRPQGTRAALKRLEVLIDRHEIAFYQPFVDILNGVAATELGEPRRGIGLIERGIAHYRRAGVLLYTSVFHRWLASACGLAGDLPRARAELATAEEIAQGSMAFARDADLVRVAGEVMALSGDRAGAETTVRRALRIAREEGVILWELNARRTLERLQSGTVMDGAHAPADESAGHMMGSP